MPEQLEHAALAEATVRHPFGPGFFLAHLRAFACERCPDPAMGLPIVEIHLVDGEVLNLCHIVGVTPSWIVLAVNEVDRAASAPGMRTEIVPYEAIARVTIRPVRSEAPHIGFEHSRVPPVLRLGLEARMTPEDTLRAAAEPRAPTGA